jgi:phosphoribosylglycinamide formyltransferase-1
MIAKVVILISGAGSNLQALLDAQLPMHISLVVSNNPDAAGLQKAQAAGIETGVLNHREFLSREAYDAQLLGVISPYRPDWVILAGFMRRLTSVFVQAFSGRLVNIHPSLLPKYPGLNTYARALAAGDKQVGATVHFVTEAVDQGPILAQRAVDVEPGDTVSQLKIKVQQLEHQLYPQVIADLLAGRLSL